MNQGLSMEPCSAPRATCLDIHAWVTNTLLRSELAQFAGLREITAGLVGVAVVKLRVGFLAAAGILYPIIWGKPRGFEYKVQRSERKVQKVASFASCKFGGNLALV